LAVLDVSTRILRLLSELSDLYASALEEINRMGGEREYSPRTHEQHPAEHAPKASPKSRSIEAISDDILATYKSELSDVLQAALEEAHGLRGERSTDRINLEEVRERYAQNRDELRRMRAELEGEMQTVEKLVQEKGRRPVGGREDEPEIRRPAPERKTLYEQLGALRDERERPAGVGIRGVCRSCGNEVGLKDLFCDHCGAYLIRICFR
jgi:small-conductance mechanosensitive channel